LAKNGIYDYSTTPASNSDIDGTDSTGATGKVKDGDNYVRSMMSHLKGFANDLGGVNTVGGTANAMTVTLGQTASAITTGMRFQAVVATANTTTTPTLTITPATGSAFAAKTIKKYDTSGVLVALQANDNAPGLREYVYLSGPDCVVLLNPAQEARYAPAHLYGLTISNNSGDATNDIDITVGACRDSTDIANIDLLAAITGKQLDAVWAVGSNAGMRASGAVIANTTYHIFIIKRPDTGVVDVAADTSASGANIAANTNAAYTLLRRIGSIVRTGGAIKAFTQTGDHFYWDTPVQDINAANPGTSAVTRVLTLPVGIRVRAIMSIGLVSTTTSVSTRYTVNDLRGADYSPNGAQDIQLTSQSTAGTYVAYGYKEAWTDASAQVRSRIDRSDAATSALIVTLGWVDYRSRH